MSRGKRVTAAVVGTILSLSLALLVFFLFAISLGTFDYAIGGIGTAIAGYFQDVGITFRCCAILFISLNTELNGLLFMDLAKIVIKTLDFQPVGIRGDHTP